MMEKGSKSKGFVTEEDEEEGQIQSSLPFYFDHIFGTRVGFSQNESQTHWGQEASPLHVQSGSDCWNIRESEPADVDAETAPKPGFPAHAVGQNKAAVCQKEAASASIANSKRGGGGGGVTERTYYCPPSCTTIAQCTEVDRTVNLIALVMQGLA